MSSSVSSARSGCAPFGSGKALRRRGTSATIGTALLERHSRGVLLTVAGAALHRHAQRILSDVDQLSADLSDYASGMVGVVRLWANTSAVTQFLPRDLASFTLANPGIRIELMEENSRETVVAVLDGRITAEQVEAFPRFLPLTDAERGQLRELFDEARRTLRQRVTSSSSVAGRKGAL